MTSISWGTLTPGGVITKTVYIKNLGTLSQSLGCTFSDWAPVAAASQITLSWNKENAVLAPGASTAAIITLNVPNTIHDITTFSVDINLTATQLA